MAHLGVAVLELQDWLTRVISGQDNNASDVDPREKEISSSCVLAVQRQSARLLRLDKGGDGSFH